MYVTSMSDLTGLLTYVSNSVMPWYITMPVPTITPSVQRRLQKIDSADAILPTPWADVSSANARSKAFKDCLFLAIAGSGVAAFDFICASIFQVSMEDDLEASSVLKKTNKQKSFHFHICPQTVTLSQLFTEQWNGIFSSTESDAKFALYSIM